MWPKDPEKWDAWKKKLSDAHFKGGSGKRIQLLFRNENGFSYAIYQRITALGKILEPTLSLSDISNNEHFYFNRAIESTLGFCLYCGEFDFLTFHEHHIDKVKSDFTVTLCANCHQRHHFYYSK